jgi:hypothetical protein
VPVTVRPEKITLLPGHQPAAAGGEIVVQGHLADSHYHGSTTRHAVTLLDGQQLVVIVQNRRSGGRNPLEPGAAVTLAWARADMQPLAGASA